jgi:hypothetical protein
MPDFSDFWIKPAIKWAIQYQWDLVLSTHGPYATHLVAYQVKKRKKTQQWIVDFRDLWTDNHINKLSKYNFNIVYVRRILMW